MRLEPYPEYKPSKLPWLTKLPAHWHEKRAKYLFREVDERSSTGDEELLSVSHLTGVTPRSEKAVTMFMAESYTGHKLCRPGDLVINTMWAWMAALGVAKQGGLVSPSYAVYRPIDRDVLSPEFADLVLRTNVYVSEYVCRSTGIRSSRLRLYPEKFLDIPIACPLRDEQDQIAAYLRRKDQQILRLIRAKRRLIELLNEQKQVIIHRTVTRGLDPNVRLKPSGIDWLGDIPDHWELKKLKHVTRFLNGLAFKPEEWVDSGVPIIRIQNLNGGSDFNYTNRLDLPHELLIQSNDLLFAWSGNRGTSFGSFLWNGNTPGYLNQHIFKLIDYQVGKLFFYYLLRAVTTHVEEQTHGIIGLVHITKPQLGSIVVPIPPDNEQAEISTSISQSCASIDRAVTQARREIALIREYRTRLVADVVTGRLDVRGVALSALDEGEPLDDLDINDDAEADEAADSEDADDADE